MAVIGVKVEFFKEYEKLYFVLQLYNYSYN